MQLDLQEIHNRCLDITDDIDRVCREHKIEYSLCGGSVIGAMLYKGFIPWDDDIDLMMTRENYNRFLKAYEQEHKEHYRILNYRYTHEHVPTLFTRIEDTRTEVEEKIAGSTRKGHVFVDITVFDHVPNRRWFNLARVKAGYTYTKLYHSNQMVPGHFVKRMAYHFAGLFYSEKNIRKDYHKLEKFVQRYKNTKTEYCAELLSAAYSGILYERSLFDNYIDTPFEDRKYRMVERFEDYLHTRYGDREFTLDQDESERQESHIKQVKA